ncbi:MAG: hypothetical protein JXA36_02890, partial [Coriobacteriia bacterium]|nr:hypothetical protein [Coriobacteriia bacterium]
VSCHVDHYYFGHSTKAYNLRSSGVTTDFTAVNTDDGLCLSCHTVDRARNLTGQKANVVSSDYVLAISESWWEVSPHNYTVTSGDFGDTSVFYANCAKCHGTLENTVSLGAWSVHESDEQRLMNALGQPNQPNLNEEDVCFRCHSEVDDDLVVGGDDGVKKTSDDYDWYGLQHMSTANVVIYGQMHSDLNTAGHKPHEYANLHQPMENQAWINDHKHVECADCHNHHLVGDARHTWGTSNVVSEAIRGVTGQGFKLGSSNTDVYDPVGLESLVGINWPTSAQVTAQLFWKDGSFFVTEDFDYATYEYEVCFKCHSGANDDLSGWGGQKSGAVTTDRWTDVARDFAIGNQSRHPVVLTNGVGRYDQDADGDAEEAEAVTGYSDTVTAGTSKVYAGQLAEFWSPGDTMCCSDCHGNEDSPLPTDPNALDYTQGPHGSTIEYSLRGPNTWWPKDPNGNLWTLNLAMTADDNGPFSGDDPFCANCHPAVAANKVHLNNTTHKASYCINCHVLIPHGAGMSRLLGDGNGVMPDRYAYNNDKNTMYMSSFLKRTDPNCYTKKDCWVTSTSSASTACGAGHSRGNTSGGSWENW